MAEAEEDSDDITNGCDEYNEDENASDESMEMPQGNAYQACDAESSSDTNQVLYEQYPSLRQKIDIENDYYVQRDEKVCNEQRSCSYERNASVVQTDISTGGSYTNLEKRTEDGPPYLTENTHHTERDSYSKDCHWIDHIVNKENKPSVREEYTSTSVVSKLCKQKKTVKHKCCLKKNGTKDFVLTEKFVKSLLKLMAEMESRIKTLEEEVRVLKDRPKACCVQMSNENNDREIITCKIVTEPSSPGIYVERHVFMKSALEMPRYTEKKDCEIVANEVSRKSVCIQTSIDTISQAQTSSSLRIKALPGIENKEEEKSRLLPNFLLKEIRPQYFMEPLSLEILYILSKHNKSIQTSQDLKMYLFETNINEAVVMTKHIFFRYIDFVEMISDQVECQGLMQNLISIHNMKGDGSTLDCQRQERPHDLYITRTHHIIEHLFRVREYDEIICTMPGEENKGCRLDDYTPFCMVFMILKRKDISEIMKIHFVLYIIIHQQSVHKMVIKGMDECSLLIQQPQIKRIHGQHVWHMFGKCLNGTEILLLLTEVKRLYLGNSSVPIKFVKQTNQHIVVANKSNGNTLVDPEANENTGEKVFLANIDKKSKHFDQSIFGSSVKRHEMYFRKYITTTDRNINDSEKILKLHFGKREHDYYLLNLIAKPITVPSALLFPVIQNVSDKVCIETIQESCSKQCYDRSLGYKMTPERNQEKQVLACSTRNKHQLSCEVTIPNNETSSYDKSINLDNTKDLGHKTVRKNKGKCSNGSFQNHESIPWSPKRRSYSEKVEGKRKYKCIEITSNRLMDQQDVNICIYLDLEATHRLQVGDDCNVVLANELTRKDSVDLQISRTSLKRKHRIMEPETCIERGILQVNKDFTEIKLVCLESTHNDCRHSKKCCNMVTRGNSYLLGNSRISIFVGKTIYVQYGSGSRSFSSSSEYFQSMKGDSDAMFADVHSVESIVGPTEYSNYLMTEVRSPQRTHKDDIHFKYDQFEAEQNEPPEYSVRVKQSIPKASKSLSMMCNETDLECDVMPVFDEISQGNVCFGKDAPETQENIEDGNCNLGMPTGRVYDNGTRPNCRCFDRTAESLLFELPLTASQQECRGELCHLNGDIPDGHVYYESDVAVPSIRKSHKHSHRCLDSENWKVDLERFNDDEQVMTVHGQYGEPTHLTQRIPQQSVDTPSDEPNQNVPKCIEYFKRHVHVGCTPYYENDGYGLTQDCRSIPHGEFVASIGNALKANYVWRFESESLSHYDMHYVKAYFENKAVHLYIEENGIENVEIKSLVCRFI